MSQPRQATVVARLRARLAGLVGIEIALAIVAALGLVAMLGVVLDATIILPEDVRADGLWILAAAAVAVVAVGAARLARLKAVRVARRLERTEPALGTALTNAVQLQGRTGRSAIEEVLRREAVAYGGRKAQAAAVWPLARRGMLAVVAVAAVAGLAWVAGPLGWPEVFDAVLPRLTDPAGDHPPYSRLRIEVEPGDAETLYGGPCEIHATAVGLPVEKLYLVTENAEGAAESVMFRSPDGSFFQTLTNLRDETRYWVTDGRARSHFFRIAIQYTPRITLVEVRTEFPAYTGVKPRTQKVEKADLRVPPRTKLSFRVASNRPLETGNLELVPILGGRNRTVALAPAEQGGSVVAGGFEASEAVAFAVTVRDVDGLASAETVKGRVMIVPDRRPRVLVIEPNRRVLATPEVSIPVHIRAEDDYAVAGVLWFRGLNQSLERSLRMTLTPRGGPGNVEAVGRFDLKDLGVRPGDRIAFFFEALDNYPDGPNVASSPVHVLEIISAEQYKQIMESMKAQRDLFEQYTSLADQLRRIQERAEVLEEHLRKLGAEGGSPEEKAALRKELAELRKALQEYQKALARAAGAPPQFDVESAFQASLAGQRGEVEKMLKELAEMMQAAGGGVPDPKAVAEIARRLRDLAGRTNANVGEPARLIVQVVRILALADLYAQLTVRQKELADLANRFKERQGVLSRTEQMELQELAAQEEHVRDALKRMMEDLPELLDQLPREPRYDKLRASVGQFMGMVNNLAIQRDLDAAAELLAGLDGRAGYWRARQAAEKMEQLVKKVEAMNLVGVGGECLIFQPTLQSSLGNTLAQVLGAMRGGGGSGGAGYGLYGDDVGLYGPEVQLTGQQGGRTDRPTREAKAEGTEAAGADATDTRVPQAKGPLRIRLQRDAKFPLRYRDLVGEYFRAVAESQE
jgi:predicted nuclease with TOPRIM domain